MLGSVHLHVSIAALPVDGSVYLVTYLQTVVVVDEVVDVAAAPHFGDGNFPKVGFKMADIPILPSP
jgi:hypothetical protein